MWGEGWRSHPRLQHLMGKLRSESRSASPGAFFYCAACKSHLISSLQLDEKMVWFSKAPVCIKCGFPKLAWLMHFRRSLNMLAVGNGTALSWPVPIPTYLAICQWSGCLFRDPPPMLPPRYWEARVFERWLGSEGSWMGLVLLWFESRMFPTDLWGCWKLWSP